jgi:hypothetical protein
MPVVRKRKEKVESSEEGISGIQEMRGQSNE